MQNMAALLGITASRIRIVSVVAGSAIVNYEIAQDPALAEAPIPARTFDTSQNIDSETGVSPA